MDRGYLVTIPLELYNELLEVRFEKARVEQNLEELLETAELNSMKQELIFDYQDIRDFLKTISLVAYKRRLEELNKEEMGNEQNSING